MPKHTEDALHTEIADALEMILAPDVVWWSNESRGVGPREGARRKARGVKAGVPDMEFHFAGRSHFIEIKTPNGRMSQEQRFMAVRIQVSGHSYHICRSVADVIDSLQSAGCPLRIRIPQQSTP